MNWEHKPEATPPLPAHHNAPAGTSEAAAWSMTPHAPRVRERILELIRAAGPRGVIDDDGEAALSIKPQTYTPRRGELVTAGLVVDSGRRRRTESGRTAAVWIAAEHASTGTNNRTRAPVDAGGTT